MRKLKLFLDTSVISHIEAPHKPSEEAATRWFFHFVSENANEFDLVISQAVLAEINACPNAIKRTRMLLMLNSLNIKELPESDEADRLALEYLKNGILSERSFGDLTHIAYAVVNNCDYILSWNFRHFVNIRTINAVNTVNGANMYSMSLLFHQP
ncbi:MAG: PIN domain-containing protein [Thermoguttaceae bacterium]